MDMTNELDFSVIKDGERVTGFTLKGNGTTEGDCYAVSFLTAQALSRAKIEFENGKVRFIHHGVPLDKAEKRFGIYGSSDGGTFEHDISQEEAQALEDLLYSRGEYANTQPRARLDLAWGKGFSLTVQ